VFLAGALITPACGSRASGAADLWGPYAVGVRTVDLTDTTVQVWYPADRADQIRAQQGGAQPAAYDIRDWLPPGVARDVTPGRFDLITAAYRDLPVAGSPARRGGRPFPLVLFVHGLYSFPDQSTELTTWLASWGYVVAAPDLPVHDLAAYFDYTAQGRSLPPGPSDQQVLAATLAALRAQSTTPGGLFDGRLTTGRFAIIGHSQGGIDAMAFASTPGTATYIPLAAGFGGPHPQLPHVPSLYVAGQDDRDIPLDLVRRVYATAPPPKRLLVLPGAGHLAFTDLCLINAARGGLGALAGQINSINTRVTPGAPFTAAALDGCGPSFTPPATSTARLRAAVLGQLHRWLPGP
jgi:dienelactone hydrolase